MEVRLACVCVLETPEEKMKIHLTQNSRRTLCGLYRRDWLDTDGRRYHRAFIRTAEKHVDIDTSAKRANGPLCNNCTRLKALLRARRAS